MKVPRKITCRRTLPKVPLKDQNHVLPNNTTTYPVNKAISLKPLPDNVSNQNEKQEHKFIKSKTKQPVPSISKINPLLTQLKYATDGMEAFIILFQRLTSDTDVFALPQIKNELLKYKTQCFEMKLKLDETNTSYRRLQEEIDIQKIIHEEKLKQLQEIHAEQLNLLIACHKQELIENTEIHEAKLKDFEEKLQNQEKDLHCKFKNDLLQIRNEAEEKLKNILEETENQVNILRIENESWKQKLEKDSRLKTEELENNFKVQLEKIKNNCKNKEGETKEETISQEKLSVENEDECHVVDIEEYEYEAEKYSLESSSSHNSRQECQNLKEEICSLRTVLDLKQCEIQELRKLNEKLCQEAQDLPFILQKLDSTQARVEDLNAQLQLKIEKEKKLLNENQKLMETVQSDSEKKKRLTFQNEELLWKLKKSAQVAKTLALFRDNCKKKCISDCEKIYNSTPSHPQNCQTKKIDQHFKRSKINKELELDVTSNDDSTPKVLGVVEKNDSVSWVLEIDESPVAVASRMLRRTNSLKGVPVKKKPNPVKQSLTLPARSKKHTDSSTTSITGSLPARFDSQCEKNSSVTNIIKNGLNDVAIKNCKNSSKDDEKFSAITSKNSTDEKNSSEDDDESVIMDVASFFDFLHDSDFETDFTLDTAENNNNNRKIGFFSADNNLASFSSSTSSDSSLDFEVFGKDIESLSYSSQFIFPDDSSDSKSEQIVTLSPTNIVASGSAIDDN